MRLRKSRLTDAAHSVIPLVIIASAIAMIYAPVVHHEYLGIDENWELYGNELLRNGLSMEGIIWAIRANLTLDSGTNYWQPALLIFNMISIDLVGLDPGSQHLVNVILHLLASCGWFFLLRSLTHAPVRSFLVAILFAVHPIHVESVAWISERKDSLSTIFGLGAIASYAAFHRAPSFSRLILLMASFVASLAVKPMLVTLPFILILLHFWPLPPIRDRRSLLSRGGVLGFMFLISMAFTWNTLRAVSAVVVGLEDSWNPWAIPLGYVSYLRRLIWPEHLGFYPPPPIFEGTMLVASIVLLAAISAGCWRISFHCRAIGTGWLWFLASLSPVIGIMNQGPADYYAYFPFVGLYLAVIFGFPISLLQQSLVRAMLIIALVFIIGMLSAISRGQVGYWKNPESVLRRSLALNGSNYHAHYFLGSYFAQKNMLSEAQFHLREAVNLKPRAVRAQQALGLLFENAGDETSAEECYSRALKVNPSDEITLFLLGHLEYRQQRFSEASAHFKNLANNHPQSAKALNMIGTIAMIEGRYADAVIAYQSALPYHSNRAAMQYNIAGAQYWNGDFDAAWDSFRTAVGPVSGPSGAEELMSAYVRSTFVSGWAATDSRAIEALVWASQNGHAKIAQAIEAER